ncbi:MAG: hypothetical protein WCP57_09350 [Bacteroidota bacterium]
MKKLILTSIFSLALVGSIFATDARVTERLAKMNSRVHFTTEQTTKVQSILEARFVREDELSAKLTGKDLQTALVKVRQDSNGKIVSLLTDDQKKVYLNKGGK